MTRTDSEISDREWYSEVHLCKSGSMMRLWYYGGWYELLVQTGIDGHSTMRHCLFTEDTVIDHNCKMTRWR